MGKINSIQVSGVSYTIEDINAQPLLSAGTGIVISGNVISATGGSGSGSSVVEVTQAEYDALVSAGTVDLTALYVITDATPIDISNYYTSAQTESAITQAVSGKVDTSAITSSVTSASTDSEIPTAKAVYDAVEAGGGGKAIEAGRGITVTTGETADTVSFNLPISAGTGNYSIIEGYSTSAMSYGDHAEGSRTYAKGNSYPAHAEGDQTTASGFCTHAEGRLTEAFGETSHAEGKATQAIGNISHAEGYETKAEAQYSHTEGYYTSATSVSNVSGIQTYNGYQARHAEGCNTLANNSSTHAEGYYTVANNFGEHASGVYNVSNSATTTYGNSGNTLFSVGNGTSDSARHNAFEIRQNGDIYITKDGADVKLQDQLGGGGSSYTAGDGIDITNDVISVTGKVDTSTYNTYTAATATEIGDKLAVSDFNTYSGTVDTVINSKASQSDLNTLSGTVTAHTANTDIHVTTAQTAAWNAKSDFSGNYNDLTNKPTIPTVPTSNTAFTNDAGYITSDAISGKVDTSTYETYTAATDAALASKANTATTYTKTEVDTALASKQTTLTAGTNITIVDNVISATGGGGGMTEDDELLLSTALTDLNDRKIDASEVKSNYQKKGDYVTTSTLNTRLAEYETALDEQNVEEVTAYALNDLNNKFGGLSLVKITESEYAALATKDENTLYIVVADPSQTR